jgi:quercetin dioxygenase-like cupin family protein
MDVVRFGVGHRRPDGPPGTTGVAGQVIHSDGRGVVAELAFGRRAAIEPHTNPNTTWFVVIEGGGWVQVGEERARIAAGEAVLWPAGIDHAAWTEHGEMRAFTIEFPGPDDGRSPGVVAGAALRLSGASADPAVRGEGALRPTDRPRSARESEGEPD